MGVLVRTLGWIGLAAASAALALDVLAFLSTGAFAAKSAGERWYALHPPSLNLAQAVVQRRLWPKLWDDALFPVLTVPAWIVLGVPAGGLLLLGRRRAKP